ncbi:MAG: transglutaminaseTgpA domain-containing protein [Caldisericia bacterium]
MKKYSIENVLKILSYSIGFEIFLFSFRNVSILYLSISLIIFIFAIYKDFIKYFSINRNLLNFIAIIFIVLIFMRITLSDIITPALESLLVLLSIKFIEDKETRDYLQIFLISILIFTGATIFSFEISFIVYFLIFIFLLNLTIVFLTYFSQDKKLSLKFNEITKIIYKTTLIPLISFPVTVFLFFALPRTPYPLFNFFGSTLTARSGFTENVKLGTVSDIQEDNSIIFRVSTEKIDDDYLYWRGITLEYFEGNEWSDIDITSNDKKIKVEGRIVNQTIYLEPYAGNYLFGLDKPVNITNFRNIYKKDDFTFYTKEILSNKIRYEVKSIMTDIIEEKLTQDKYYLELPENLSKEIRNLSLNFNDENKLDAVRKVENFLKNGEYKYSLKNLPTSKNPIDEFLFKTKEGNCEYFATSMAIILRVLGIPSRVVAGYRGGVYNDLGNYYIVRQSDAHLWVEVYIDNIGWIRFDPTPSIPSEELILNRKKLTKFSLFLDTINYYYNTLIINYDLEKQISLFNKIREGFKKPEIKISVNLKKLSSSIIITFSFIFLLFFIIKSKKRSYEERILNIFNKKMEKLGIKKKKNEGLEEFLQKIENQEIKESIKNFVIKFEEFYYKDKKINKEDYIIFKKLLSEVRISS